jgi:hypothetical protein
MCSISFSWCLLTAALVGAEPAIRPDLPYPASFAPEDARFVRLVIDASSGGEPCVDELEVFGPDGKRNLALASQGAKATASSCYSGSPSHAIEHLNDGEYGNDRSWIAAGTGREWAQIELPRPARIAKVVLSRDRRREFADRVPVRFEVQLSPDGKAWKTVKRVETVAAAVATRRRMGPSRFAGLVPPPPPPPRIEASGKVVTSEPAPDLRAATKDDLGFSNLALDSRAKAAASSALTGYPIHQITHLNDGQAGNDHSWISDSDPSWAEIDLGDTYWVYQAAFGSDSSRRYDDRAATSFAILAATEHNQDTKAGTWKVVHRQDGGPGVQTRQAFKFKPVQARWVRIAVDASNANQARIDEIEIFGQKEPIPLEKIGPLPQTNVLAQSGADGERMLRYAIIGEEHAWLKTYGRADISPRLVPYNGRVKEYPRHVGDDHLPLAPLAAAPTLDGKLDEACWDTASRGVVRVAWPYEFEKGPLVEYAVRVGTKGDDLYLAVQTNRLLSSHVAVISRPDGAGCGVLTYAKDGLVFSTYEPGPDGRGVKPIESRPVEGACDKSLTAFEVRLPLSLFPDCRAEGLRIGLGMGGRHALPEGRGIVLQFSPLSIGQVGPCLNNVFRVQLAAAAGDKPVTVRGQLPGLTDGLALAPGQSKVLEIPAEAGPIGPQCKLTLEEEDGGTYTLNLFRYDPVARTITLLDEMIGRFAAKGIDVTRERQQLADLRKRHEAMLAAAPDTAAERETLFAARVAKRELFFRDRDLAPIERILFVKRHAYEPSHNYSVMLDSAWRPGGGVYTMDIPRRGDRLVPGEARLTELFNSGRGITRDPMASFDARTIYFAYRESQPEYYHVMRMDPDGKNVVQLTDGPFHDYWPCPLPDGGLALISTRCRARFLCWRPQTAVMFRMDADGQNIRPLSYANLSEWGPSVMRDGRIIWTRSEYIDKGADFSHTLWSIRPDGTKPELVFGNTIIQPNGYANGREVPGTHEICCTLISHFGDLNGPITLIDIDKGRFNPKAITSITPEVPWPGMWPDEECFRDPVPVAADYFICSHAPRRQFGLYVIDRFGNREMLYQEEVIGAMCPTLLRPVEPPPALQNFVQPEQEKLEMGQFAMADVYQGIAHAVPRGTVKYIRVVEELRANLIQMPDGAYQKDHEPFMHYYAAPVDILSGPFGWPSYVAKADMGLAPVEEDGSAHFSAPAGKQLYLQVLDKDFNELQRMRSVVQLQPGEQRSCIGCHEDRRLAPPAQPGIALRRGPSDLAPPPWGAGPVAYEKVVQPVLDAKCVRCHDAADKKKIDLTGTLDVNRVPASYRTLISQGWVHVLDCGWNSGGNEKREPLSFGTLKSRLFTEVLNRGHQGIKLTTDEMRAIKCWIDMNCPLWPDYILRESRPGPEAKTKLTRRN